MATPTLPSLFPRGFAVPTVDQVMVEERARSFCTRSIKNEAKLAGLKLAVRMMDLTTLEGMDTPGKVASLCQKALHPMPARYHCPPCGAVCVYPNLVSTAVTHLKGSGVHVASVATAFPSGQCPLPIKIQEVRAAVAAGADEIDMVIDRGAFLRGDYAQVAQEIAAVRDACGQAHLKVILETGELKTYDNVRLASEIAMRSGAHFIKTSTGKVNPAATMAVTLVMLEAIRDYFYETGSKIGMKPAGGIRKSKEALHYLVMLKETLGDAWLTPDLFRFGASSLLTDVTLQIAKLQDGVYQSEDYFSIGKSQIHMFVWSKLSSTKWEDAWQERFHAAANTSLVISQLPNSKSIRVEVYCQRESNALAIQKMFGGSVRELKNRNWQAESAKSLKPINVRGKLIIAHTEEAAEKERKTNPGKIVLCIPGEMAFGTGDHPTTATCLRLLVDFAAEQTQKWNVLDLGCGTGILALAAKALGAAKVEGCDYDPDAVKISKKNAKLNNIPEVRFWQEDVLKWVPTVTYPLVLANIFHDVLTVSFEKIAKATASGGKVFVSGILREQAENVLSAARNAGLMAEQVTSRGKWVTIVAEKNL
jgi:deoxyribose-phosphate aldolase